MPCPTVHCFHPGSRRPQLGKLTRRGTHMKSSRSRNVCASAAAIFLTMALAGSAAMDTQAPLNGSSQKDATDFLQQQILGSLQGRETDMPEGDPPQQLSVNGEVKG